MQAVKLKMFGPMTRQNHEWHPARSLCKRFNVPNPYPDSNMEGVPHLQKAAANTKETLFNLGLPSTEQELANRKEMDARGRRREADTGPDTVPTCAPEPTVRIIVGCVMRSSPDSGRGCGEVD